MPKKSTTSQPNKTQPNKTQSNKTQPNKTQPNKPKSFPIVGIGASAGGLEALRQLLNALPEEPGVAIVIIQHLDPTRKSLAPELLSKVCKLKVCEVTDEPHVKPNRVYMIPPNKYLSIAEGELHLSEPDRPRGARMAIDYFLRSLAKDQQQCAVGVILSGSGTDGTLGLKAIKAAGGLCIAQEPSSAEHDNMPRSAIKSKVVDHTLPPAKIPAVLVRYAEHPYVCDGDHALHTDEEQATAQDEAIDEEGLKSVVALLRAHTKHDFRDYKDRTLLRRTRRRMCLHHLDDYDEYVDLLRSSSAELAALKKDLLISVTDFFRDPEAWEELQRLAIEPLVQEMDHDDDSPIRVWTPGCATGEEPYSMAMLILEALKRAGKNCPVQVFASDIDKDALEYARAGRYPKTIEADVSAERLRRFFTTTEDDDYYEVHKSLRETVVFADQNLIADPPFSKLDLICCRNLLIYLKPTIQEKVIALFHFSLREEGTLFLGSAETIGRQKDLFDTRHKRWRIFRRIGAAQPDRVDIPLTTGAGRREIQLPSAPPQRRQTRLTHLAQQCLLDALAPTAVLVNRDWQILYICGDVDPYITRKAGVPSDSLLDNARRGLRTKLRGAIHTAFSQQRSVTAHARVQNENATLPVTVTVRLIHDHDEDEALALVLFEQPNEQPNEHATGKPARQPVQPTDPHQHPDQATTDNNKPDGPREDDGKSLDDDVAFQQLEEELSDTKDELQSTIEQLETSNEEFKASNEEVMSINEELQSTNEELETSKEELQSLNEELSTVNSQLAGKVDELETKHSDLENLIAATEMATVCLDTQLCVRWFTPAAQQVIRLKPGDIGRPLADFANDFTDGDLVEIVQRVLKKLTPVEDEVTCRDDRTYLRRVTPYRSAEHRIGGVVMTLVDITRRKQGEQELRISEEQLRLATEGAGIGTWEWYPETDVLRWSEQERQLVGCDPVVTETTGQAFFDRVHPDDLNDMRKAIRASTEQGAIYDQEFRVIRDDGRTRWLAGKGVVHLDRAGHPVRMIGVNFDITQQKQMETELRELNESLEEQVAQRTEMLRMLQDVTRGANQASSVKEALSGALARIVQYNGWKVGHVWRLADDESGDFVSSGIWHVAEAAHLAVTHLEEFQELCRQQRFSSGERVIGAVAETGARMWLDDITQASDWRRGDAAHLGLRAMIAFPITVRGHTIAVMEFFSEHPACREEPFMEIMPDIGIQLGHVFQRQDFQKQVADAAEREKRRVGSDIHDGVGQELTGLRYIAQTHAELLNQQSSPQAEVAQRITAGLETVQQQMRGVIRDLIPVELSNKGLAAALDMLAERTDQVHRCGCEFQCDATILIEDNLLATHLYRIAQEAVANAVSHACGRTITIKLREKRGWLMLQVADDGDGFDHAQQSNSGFGLRSIGYRADLIGAKLTIRTGRQGGTLVRCTVKIHP